MNYKETLEFLASRGNEVQFMHLGLHRTHAMMKALDDPHRAYPSVHIAGTNGKGSVAAMSESILRASGLTTGMFTSPHLTRVEERIRINGQQISPGAFAAIATLVKEAEEGLLGKKVLDRLLTTFEFLTCCAFLHFAKKKVDIAVVEVGLGGKLDSTNVIIPEVSVITGIALDHQAYLGNTIAEIAAEKAGIIKEGVPVISGAMETAARRIIQKRAKSAKSSLFEICEWCSILITGEKRGFYSFDFSSPLREYKDLRISLAGEHQTRNAALSIMAMESLHRTLVITPSDIRRGLAATVWPGRLEEIRSRRRTLLDGAHNPEGAILLRDHLSKRKEKELHFVFGAVRDKDISKIGAAVFPMASSIHLTPLANSRSATPEEIQKMFPSFKPQIRIHSNMQEALLAAWKECPASGLVVVTGSLYLVGDLLPVVKKYAKS